MLPDAGTTTEAHAQIQQSIMELWRSIADRSRAIEMIDRVISHHAPELYGWAAQVVGRALPGQAAWERRTAVESPDAAARRVYQTLFGVEPTVTAALPAAGDVAKACERGVKLDPELARLAVLLHHVGEIRLWAVGQHLTSEGDGSGQIERAALREALARFGVPYTTRHMGRLLKAGDGTFWNCDGRRIFLRSWKRVSVQLAAAAFAVEPDAVKRNKPGVRRMWIDPAGTPEQFETRVYGAWLAYREDPTIARDTLSMLFGRDKRTIRRWEKALGGQVEKRANYVQCPNWQKYFDAIPPHALTYAAWVKFGGRTQVVTRVHWQTSNTYCATGFTQVSWKGQASKVRGAVNAHADMPADERRGGLHLLYVDDPKTVRRIRRHHPEALPLLVWRGENRHGHGIFEINDDGYVHTRARERLDFGQERQWYAEKPAAT